MIHSTLALRIAREEGRRTHLYRDSLGVWTIGIGYNIQEKGLPDDIIDQLFERTIAEATADAGRIPEYFNLGDARRSVLVAMVFQMGLPAVLAFPSMRRALANSNFELAGDEMLDSRWARQTPGRAKREAQIMRTGRYKHELI